MAQDVHAVRRFSMHNLFILAFFANKATRHVSDFVFHDLFLGLSILSSQHCNYHDSATRIMLLTVEHTKIYGCRAGHPQWRGEAGKSMSQSSEESLP